MVSPLLALLVPALLTTSVSGDSLVLATFDQAAPDSAAVRSLHAAEGYSNAATSRDLTVEAGALKLTTDLANDSGKSYAARSGVRIALNPLWAPVDIRRARSISFRIKGSSAYNVRFSLGSELYSTVAEEMIWTAPVKVTTTWTRQIIAISPSTVIGYNCPMDGCAEPGPTDPEVIVDSTDPKFDDSARNVAMSVKTLQFAIDPSWKTGSTWVAPAAGTTILWLDDFVIEGPLGQSPAEVGPRAAHASTFAARYQGGSLALQGLDGYASLEVRTLSGARVAELSPAASVKIRLDRGAYLLVARGPGKPALSRTLAVAR